jgi:hypothetical protein
MPHARPRGPIVTLMYREMDDPIHGTIDIEVKPPPNE